MPETLEKLRPDRDLRCFFERPSAIAAMHHASPTGFQVSGTWRQQFDWAVVEWNRDNVIEHPLLRNLPDGDFRGITLTYDEARTNCLAMDSDIYPTVDWPYLRIWADDGTGEQFYRVRLKDYATAIEGSYVPATAELTLQGSPTSGDYIGISFLDEHHTYQLNAGDTLESAVQAVVDSVNAFSTRLEAERIGTTIRLTYVGEGQTAATSTTGANGNRLGVYGFVSGAKTESWNPWWTRFSGGQSPTRWRVTLPFDSLTAIDGRAVPAAAIRKMRWTYAAELQDGAFQRSEFLVEVTNWTVTGGSRSYSVAGPGSRRIEDDAPEASYSGTWNSAKGNFSGGTIHYTDQPGSSVTIQYRAAGAHKLYLGTRKTFNGATITITVDGGAAQSESLFIAGEDVLCRVEVGDLGAGDHTVTLTHNGTAGSYFYFDFIELAVPATALPDLPVEPKITLATDWDTDHSLSIPAERTAWLIQKLGFRGRVNHYVGALWFYELYRPGHQYASATVDFTGTPVFSEITELRIGTVGEPPENDTVIQHVNRIGDTAETIAKAFELELNRGYTAVRAEANGSQLVVYARAMGEQGNTVTIQASPTSGQFTAVASSSTLTGGVDGDWRTDLAASPRLNRAVRDWSLAFFQALAGYGLDAATAFSMELQHGDPSAAAGIAQRYPDGSPVLLNTPALQTNFSPTSTDFWKEVYREAADLMANAGLQPFLQFGEVQWWYFPLSGAGMPYYDDYTQNSFQSTYGRAMAVIMDQYADPNAYPDEAAFLPTLIGQFTDAVMAHVRASHPNCRFEVLYPTDVNETPWNSAVNYPAAQWTPSQLTNLKTESFTYTYTRDLDKAKGTVEYGKSRGFTQSARSFLVGISDSSTAWIKELRHALAENVESIVLFALDQYCLIGYPTPLPRSSRRALRLG